MGKIRGESTGSVRSTVSGGISAGVILVAAMAMLPAGAGDAPPARSGPPGTLRGRVILGPQISSHRMRFSLYADAHRAAVETAPRPITEELQNVVVYLEHVPDGVAPPARLRVPARMEQEGLSFKPHVLAVVKGTEVEFPNRDMLFHNVFSLSKAASFDLGRFAQNASKSLRFAKPGIVKVFCHIHSDMSGVIVVLDNPFFASPASDGEYVIDGIPPGEYRVIAWHERARMAAKAVRIEAGQDAVLDFEIPLTEDADGG
jgi:plastocyanin